MTYRRIAASFNPVGCFSAVERSGARRAARKRDRRPLERHSTERVGTVIMEYLVHLREYPEPGFEVGISPYAIMRGARRLNTQKQDRVEYILDLLEKNGLVRSRSSQQARYYEVTVEGVEWYKKTAKAFYQPFSEVYKEREL